MKTERGFTLIELMIAATVMMVAIAACTALLITAMRLDRNGQQRVDTGDRARIALGDILDAVDRTGIGSMQGVMVNRAGTPTNIFPVFGIDGSTGQGAVPVPAGAIAGGHDDLWLVAAQRSGLGESCQDRGAQVPITNGVAGGSGQTLPVPCTSGFLAGDMLLASSQGASALLSGVTVPSGTTVGFAESSLAGFAPNGSGFRVGDTLMTVTLTHYFIAPDPTDPLGHTGLWKGVGVVQVDSYGRPFADGPVSMVASDIEDLQIAYGYDTTKQGNPDTYTFSDGLSPVPGAGNSVAGASLRALRVSVVARSHLAESASDISVNRSLTPLTVENHIPTPTPDGVIRVLVTRRAELTNLSPGSI